jgi:hypothetical protein
MLNGSKSSWLRTQNGKRDQELVDAGWSLMIDWRLIDRSVIDWLIG